MDRLERAIMAVQDARPYATCKNEAALAEAMRLFLIKEGHDPEKPQYLSRNWFEVAAKTKTLTFEAIQAFLADGPKTFDEISQHVGLKGRKLRELLRDARRQRMLFYRYVKKKSVHYSLEDDAASADHEVPG